MYNRRQDRLIDMPHVDTVMLNLLRSTMHGDCRGTGKTARTWAAIALLTGEVETGWHQKKRALPNKKLGG